jgi:fumarylacetoacetate (FAA) hydrolase family protein
VILAQQDHREIRVDQQVRKEVKAMPVPQVHRALSVHKVSKAQLAHVDLLENKAQSEHKARKVLPVPQVHSAQQATPDQPVLKAPWDLQEILEKLGQLAILDQLAPQVYQEL